MNAFCELVAGRAHERLDALQIQVDRLGELAASYRDALVRITREGDGKAVDIAAKALGSPESAIEERRR